MKPQPLSSCFRAFGKLASAVFLFSVTSPLVWSQTTPRILHQGVTCMIAGEHLILEALVEPADQLVTVKAYFRAEIYPSFFYVEMTRTGDRFQGVLPRPTRDIQSVVYYLEAVDSAFNSLRTEEFRPRVEADASDCRDDGPPPGYLEGPANIAVGSTTPGATFPPGFLTEGIVATISSAGRVVAGSGAGAGTIIAVGAAAGAAAGVGILVAGGDAATTTSAPSGVVTTTAPTTTAPPTTTTTPSGSLLACFETQPNPPTIPVGGTVRFDASCSGPDRDQIVTFAWTFGDGREPKEGRVVTRVYNQRGVFTAELTVTDAAGNVARTSKDVRVEENAAPPPPSGPAGVIAISKGGPPAATIGVPFQYSITVSNISGASISGVTMTDAVPPSLTISLVTFTAAADNCGQAANTVTCAAANLGIGASFTVTITVTPTASGSINNSASVVSVSPSGSSSASHVTAVALRAFSAFEAAFVSEIQSPSSGPSGQTRASLELNRSETALTEDAGPKRHAMKGQAGQNILAGFVTGASLDGALWRLDFTGTAGFVPGSLVVETGDVVSSGSATVVFRLSGGESRIRVRFRLEPPGR